MKNRPKNWNYVGWNCVGLGKFESIPPILHMKMTGVIRLTLKVILGVNRQRIWTPPTQFRKLKKYFRMQFPGNCIKILIFPESAWFTDSFPLLENKKIAQRKKLLRFPNPEFNLYMAYHKSIKSILKSLGCNKKIPREFYYNFVFNFQMN